MTDYLLQSHSSLLLKLQGLAQENQHLRETLAFCELHLAQAQIEHCLTKEANGEDDVAVVAGREDRREYFDGEEL